MKRLLSLILAFTITLSLCACQGNFGSVNLNEAVEIPEDGIIKENILKQIKNENAIGVFAGESNGLRYEWTIFGSDIGEPKEINLGVQLHKTEGGNVRVVLRQGSAFDFSALLSIYMDEQWNAQSATAYAGNQAFASVSVTGSKATILNLTLDGSADDLEIRPDVLPEDTTASAGEATEATRPATGNDDYLSKPEDSDDTVYTDGKDKYLTDPIPEGKPQPVEPEDQEVDTETTYTCTFSIECSTILNNLDMLDPDKLECVPSNGIILATITVTFY